MVKLDVRYVVARKSGGKIRYYWQPKKEYHEAGFKPVPLGDDKIKAIAKAESWNEDLDRWRAGQLPRVAAEHRYGSFPWLIALYESGSDFKHRPKNTQRSYREAFKHILKWSESINNPAAKNLSREGVMHFKEELQETSDHHAAKVLRVLSLLLSYAYDRGIIDQHPAYNLKLKTARRDVIWTEEEIALVKAQAIDMGYQSIALAVDLAFNLAQSEADVLAMTWSKFDGAKFLFRRQKTGKIIDVPATEALIASLSTTVKQSPIIVVSEDTKAPYNEDHFRHLFLDIRRAAGLREGLWFSDLRSTGMVRMGRAGCEVQEIAAVSGHSINTTSNILETYLPRDSEMAANAIAKLETYRATKRKVGKVVGKAAGRVGKGGRHPGTRTLNPRIKSPLLYQLS